MGPYDVHMFMFLLGYSIGMMIANLHVCGMMLALSFMLCI